MFIRPSRIECYHRKCVKLVKPTHIHCSMFALIMHRSHKAPFLFAFFPTPSTNPHHHSWMKSEQKNAPNAQTEWKPKAREINFYWMHPTEPIGSAISCPFSLLPALIVVLHLIVAYLGDRCATVHPSHIDFLLFSHTIVTSVLSPTPGRRSVFSLNHFVCQSSNYSPCCVMWNKTVSDQFRTARGPRGGDDNNNNNNIGRSNAIPHGWWKIRFALLLEGGSVCSGRNNLIS